MKTIVLSLTLLIAPAMLSTSYAAPGGTCAEIFATARGQQQLFLNRIPQNYHEYTEMVDYMVRLMSKGVAIEFYSSKQNKNPLAYSRSFVEPVISAQWSQGLFDPKQTRIFLPLDSTSIEPRQGLYQLLTQLVRMHRILELQGQGALFDRESMLFNNQVTLIGFQENVQMTDVTLTALQHAFTTFGVKSVNFVPLDSIWAQFAIPPQLAIARNTYNKSTLFVRAFYLERADYWFQLAGELETKMFTRFGHPFFRSPNTPLQ